MDKYFQDIPYTSQIYTKLHYKYACSTEKKLRRSHIAENRIDRIDSFFLKLIQTAKSRRNRCRGTLLIVIEQQMKLIHGEQL